MNVDCARLSLQRGAAWFATGWRTFSSVPGLLLGVLLLWLVIAVALDLVPLIGSVIFAVISPTLYAGYLFMCREAAHNGRAGLDQFFAGLTRAEVRGRMITLGLLLLLTHVVVIAIGAIFYAGFSLALIGAIPVGFEEVTPEQLLADTAVLLVMVLTLLLMLLFYTLVAMAFTYACPLVLDRRAEPLAALGLSLKACLVNILPLTVFGLLYLVFFVIAVIPLGLGLLVFLPVSLAAIATSYEEMFGTAVD